MKMMMLLSFLLLMMPKALNHHAERQMMMMVMMMKMMMAVDSEVEMTIGGPTVQLSCQFGINPISRFHLAIKLTCLHTGWR